MNNPSIIPSAEPFFFPGGRTGCLLVHGFTGAPKEMRWLGEDLTRRGYSVLGVRLAGHATRPEDMLRARWEDWLLSVEDGWHLLSGGTDKIFVMGLSMGGILSLLFAADHPVAGVVAMSTPYHLPRDPRLPYAELLSKLSPSITKGPPDWHDPEVARDHVDYPSYPTRAIAELRDLLVEMRSALPRVSAPALLIHSKDDGSVRPEEGHVEQIFAALGSQDKQVLWIEGSGHVITRDAARYQVFQAVADFIQRID
jgi:carboxylesterase